jgi:hypothetical protein
MVPGGLVDTVNHTVSVAVEQFSIFALFEDASEAAYDAIETLIGDERARVLWRVAPRDSP